MDEHKKDFVNKTKNAALEVLLHNNHGAYRNLPGTAGWGCSEPYTRDLLICSLGILTAQNKRLLESLRIVLETLAKNQSKLSHIRSVLHELQNIDCSDTTLLFLMPIEKNQLN